MNILSRKDKSWDKNLPTNEKWKRVIHEIYISPCEYAEGKLGYIDKDHSLVEKLKLKPTELGRIIRFLRDHGLISEKEPYNRWELTKKGFNVALQNEEIKSDKSIKIWLMIYAAISAVAAIIQIII